MQDLTNPARKLQDLANPARKLQDLANPARKSQSQTIFGGILGDAPSTKPESKSCVDKSCIDKSCFDKSCAQTIIKNNKNNISISNITLYYLQQQPKLLSSLKSFNAFFGNNSNNYHPHEITAKFSEWYLEYILGNMKESYDNYKGFIIYKTYFNNLIKTFY